MSKYQSPVASWVESFTDWLTSTSAGLLGFLQTVGQNVIDSITALLTIIPPLVPIVLLATATFFIFNKKVGLGLFISINLIFIYNQSLWNDLMSTVTLVLLSSVISIIIGIPLGILMVKGEKTKSIIAPVLDFMQTMPGFVYLISAVAFFEVGIVPRVLASVIFALPPTAHFMNLGIQQVPNELIETADFCSSTGRQKLFKLELPLAKNTIMAGVNQATMLALSMVTIASMIDAPGLGHNVSSALQRAQVGSGFVNGMVLVILATIIDRFIQHLNNKKTAPKAAGVTSKKKRYGTTAAVVVIVAGLVGAPIFTTTNDKRISLSYVEWDTEIASIHVVAKALKDMGYDVKMAPLDNATTRESVARGETDAMVDTWLPGTYTEQYKQYRDKLNDLDESLKGVKLKIVVPSYTGIDSVKDLSDQAGKKITGIESGAGVVAAAKETKEAYPNLKDWSVETSSSGAATAALGWATKNNKDVIIIGWSPYWVFIKYDLKYLTDPKGTMDGGEAIYTVARQDLKKDQPGVYKVLDDFYWTTKDTESVMLETNEDKDLQEVAHDWIDSHRDQVAEWKK